MNPESQQTLNWLSFFLADVKDGLGPFLAIFLSASLHWDAGKIGIVLTISELATVVARGPMGAVVDAVTWKRTLIAGSAIAVALAAVTIAVYPNFWPIAVSQGVAGVADAIFPLAITAISLGIVGRKAFAHRIGRNEAWNHAGNVVTAILAGVGGWLIAPSMVLWMVAALASASVFVVYRIDANAINHEVARGDDEDAEDKPKALSYILDNKPLLWFTAAITLFHFSNAAMLPLAGQKLAQGQDQSSTLFMAACIIAAQLVMVPMALLVGRKADDWGRKPMFLVGFAVLPVRGLLFALADNPYAIVAIQLLDGVGAGIFGALFYIVISDFTRGSGRFNLAQGVSAASWGFGAAISNVVAGYIVNGFGYAAAFFFLGACGVGAFAIYWFAVPESRDYKAQENTSPQGKLEPQKTGA